MEKKISKRQQSFVDEYLISFNGAQAAIKAGYSNAGAREQAYRLLTKDHIKEALENGMKERSERMEISKDYVIKNLKDVIERCMQLKKKENEDGTKTDYQFNAAGANKALELLGRHLGMFVDKTSIEVSTHDNAVLELKKIIAEADK